MTLFFKMYIILWSSACLLALMLLIKHRKIVPLFQSEYWNFLFMPWRLAAFTAAALGIVLIAPYTGDPTWDYFDAFFMSVLTYLTAPWAMGTLYCAGKRKAKPSLVYAAICTWLFSASWSYDIYLVLRDGQYPITWFSNIFASSVLYISAGLFWSLDWIPGKGVTFAFMESNWPYLPDNSKFTKVIFYALPFMVLVTFLILYFFVVN